MRIVVNTRFLLPNHLEGVGYFIQEVFRRIVEKHPEHSFYFLFDRPYSQEFIFASNVTPVVLTPPARHPLLWKLWYDVRVAMFLRKIKADLFVSPDGMLSLTSSVPQCLVIHDLGFLHYPQTYKGTNARFLKRFTPAFIRKAASLATVSQFTLDDIRKQYGAVKAPTRIVYSAVKERFSPASFDEQEETRRKFTGGHYYFLYVGAIQARKNLVNLLKGFSMFKKRMQSDMKLVIVGRMAWKTSEFVSMLNSFKFRQDVILTEYIDEKDVVSLVGAAYAMVYPSFFEGFGVPVLEAMKCHVPVLTSADSSMQEIAGEAGLFFDPHKPEEIGGQMMNIYRDEDLRKELIEKGIDASARFTWERTADLMWETMMLALPSPAV